ncbi:SRPBCC domain-containing protein [Mycobacteroides sp. LB1]|uniref:SRPBCC family protein n=1 Tax=Mycobacteroides sp. LB1 TaxID=2750814 RepID=UPI0015DEBE51|nr:SRPBCC domain-containing protein [Mycobacteroides sp. LB1]
MTELRDDPTSVTVGQFYPYPADQVWRAITSAASISDWTTDLHEDSVEIGKSFSFTTFPMPEVNFSGRGECEFTSVVPNERMAYRFTTPEKSWDLQVTWTLHSEPGGTRLLVVHNGFDVAYPAHGRLRVLVRDIWVLVMSRIGELLGVPELGEDPPPDDATSFSLGEFYDYSPQTVWQVITSKEFVSDLVNESDLGSVEKGSRLSVATYPVPLIGFNGKVDMEFLEVREPELIACSFEIPIMGSITTLQMTWRLRSRDGGTQLWFTLNGFDPGSHLNRQLRSVLRGGALPVLSRVGELLEGRGHRV